jgi:glycosyltransferase involved in cell wall biosynthesis
MLRAALLEGRRRGWQVEAVFPDAVAGRAWLEDLAQEGLEVRLLSLGGRMETAEAIRRILASSAQPTILHTHFTSFDLPAVQGARGHPSTAVIWHVHTSARSHPAIVARNILKYALAGRRVARILCVSPHLEAIVRRRGGGGRTVTFANAIDVRRFVPPSAAERARARAQLRLPPSAPVLLHLAWDWRQKGGSLLLAALRRLRRERELPLLLTVGAGEEGWRAVRDARLEGSVRMQAPVEDPRLLYAACDALVVPSRGEGAPLAVLEALAMGIPVIATRAPGLYALEGVPGCRLVARESQALALAISETVRGPLSDEERRAARAWVEARYDLRSWAPRLFALYEHVLDRLPG